MAKTISERINDYVQRYDEYDRGICRDVAERAYIQGATDQRKIDIDKACEWLRQCITFQHPDYRHPVPFFDEEDIESFKRAMEE